MINGKSSDDLLSKAEAMDVLGIKSAETMSRIAKRHGVSTIKEWKNVFYPNDEILELKDRREKDRASKKPNANFRAKKSEKRTDLIAKNEAKKAKKPQAANLPVAASGIRADEANLKERMSAVVKELKEIGLYEICDKSLIYSYCLTELKLDEIAAQMKENFTTYDDKGNEKPHPLTKIYTDFLTAKLNLAKALGLGAGNRKGLKISEIIEIDEMDKLLNG